MYKHFYAIGKNPGNNKEEREILYFENFDLNKVITPVDADKLKELLIESNYCKKETNFIVDGFKNGFSLKYRGKTKLQQKAPNLRFNIGDEVDLWNKVMKEVKQKRFAGPFPEPPFEHFIQSPIGLVPKDGGKETRLIFHLSYPRQKQQGERCSQRLKYSDKGQRQKSCLPKSVNASTPERYCKVQYPDFNQAIKLCIQEGVSCNISRSDIKQAFRNLGLKPKYWRYLLMKAKSPFDNKWYYFVDKCLPFGSSVSCKLFQTVSNCIAHLVKWRAGKKPVNYLDDYLFVALIKAICNNQMEIFLEICKSIGLPVNLDKTFWASTLLTFLGFLIDTENQRVLVPKDKIVRAQNMISHVLNKKSKKLTVLQLQKICGFLNFLGKAIVPGRAFTRRLYAYTSSKKKMLKPHHHLKLSAEMQLDLTMWLEFLFDQTAFCRPFIDFEKKWKANELEFYTDASKNFRLGFGGYFRNFWMAQKWDKKFVIKHNPSIQYLELYAVVAAILAWGHFLQNKRFIIYCDNRSCCSMINSTTSKCRNCMVLIRLLVLKSLNCNFRVFAKHVKSKENGIADSLSRFQFDRFNKLKNKKKYKFNEKSTMVPEDIWPMQKIWMY